MHIYSNVVNLRKNVKTSTEKKTKRSLLVLSLLIVFAIIVLFSEKIIDVAYELRYKWNYVGEIEYSENEVREEFKLKRQGDGGGSYSTKHVKVSYAHSYDKDNAKYYYTFTNHRATRVCVRSRLFPILIGQVEIEIGPNQTMSVIVNSTKQPIRKTELVRIDDCVSFSSNSIGGSVTFAMPGE